jgi:hypothetical protein
MDFLREWFLGMAGAVMIGVFAMAVTPQGVSRKVVQIAAALVLVIAVLRPLSGVESFPQMRMEGGFPSETVVENTASVDEVLSSIIAGQTSAYIVSKAQALGLAVSVTAGCRMGEFYPEPWSVTIISQRPEHTRRALGKLIEEDLGIPLERQQYTELTPDLKGVVP